MYDREQLANNLGFSHMVKQHRIQCNNVYPGNNAENVFRVHMDTGIKEFRITDEGLYTYKPSEKYLDYVAGQKDKAPKSFMVVEVPVPPGHWPSRPQQLGHCSWPKHD